MTYRMDDGQVDCSIKALARRQHLHISNVGRTVHMHGFLQTLSAIDMLQEGCSKCRCSGTTQRVLMPTPAIDSRPKLWPGMHFISSSCLALLEIGSQVPHDQP